MQRQAQITLYYTTVDGNKCQLLTRFYLHTYAVLLIDQIYWHAMTSVSYIDFIKFRMLTEIMNNP